MSLYELKDGSVVKLDYVVRVSPLQVNKADSRFNCYEVFMIDGSTFTVFEEDLPRNRFLGHLKKGKKGLFG